MKSKFKILISLSSLFIGFFVILCFSSCKKKCIKIGNGNYFILQLYNRDSTPVDGATLNQTKFYYFQSGGTADTLTYDEGNPEPYSVRTQDVIVFLIMDNGLFGSAGIGFDNFAFSVLDKKIKDGKMYMLFPDGHVDTMSLRVSNKEGCSLNEANYNFDRLDYNDKPAEFINRAPIAQIGNGINQFKAYLP